MPNFHKTLNLAIAVLILAVIALSNTAQAGEYRVDGTARVVGVANWDVLNIRRWPAAHSRKTGAAAPYAQVWVNRCVSKRYSSDWCQISWMHQSGWVNARFLRLP